MAKEKKAMLLLSEEEVQMLFLTLSGHIAGLHTMFGSDPERRDWAAIECYGKLRQRIDEVAAAAGMPIK